MDERLTTIQHSLAYSSDKLLNLQIILMEITGRSSEIESLSLEHETVPDESVDQNIHEFQVLSAFFNSEIKVLDKHVISIQLDIVDLSTNLSSVEDSEEIKGKLVNSENSLKELQELFDNIYKQSAKFEDAIDSLVDKSRSSEGNTPQSGSGNLMSPHKQKEILQMLENSLAREMDLESRLEEASSVEENLKFRIHNLERESFFLENLMDSILERTFEAEISSDSLLGFSKELIKKFNSMQSLNVLKINSLEKELTESKNENWSLDSKIAEMKIKEESSNSKSLELDEANAKLKNEIERGNNLEKKVKDLETQLEHANASLDAVWEQQTMLESTVADMEILIKDLKGKVAKAETRAEVAESRLSASNETNMEMNEELGFLRSKIEALEGSSSKINNAKVDISKDIAIRTKAIANLVTKIASERERLQLQIVRLNEKNKIMARQLRKKEASSTLVKDSTVETISIREIENAVPVQEESGSDSSLESVRDIGLKMGYRKYVVFAVLVVLISFLVVQQSK